MKSNITCDDKIDQICATIQEIKQDMRVQMGAISKVFEKFDMRKLFAKSDIWRAFDSVESYLDAEIQRTNRNIARLDHIFILMMLAIDAILVITFIQITGITHFHLVSLLKSFIC